MNVIYVGCFVSPRDDPMHETIGWSRSEHIVKLFLKQFSFVDSEYEPVIMETEMGFNEYLNMSIDDDHEIVITTTNAGRLVGITDSLRDVFNDYVEEEDGPLFGIYDDIYDESQMYNIMYAMFDRGVIKNKNYTSIMTSLILCLYEKYRTNLLLLYERIDSIDLMININYIMPISSKE